MSFFVLINVFAVLFALVFAAPVPSRLAARDCGTLPNGPNIEVRNQIVQVALGRNVNAKVMLAMMEAAIQESLVNNLNCGNQASLGVFQQQPGYGWGDAEQIMDVTHATNAFLDVCIPLDEQQPKLTAGWLAQDTQQSQAGNFYDQHEAEATQYIAEAKAALGVSGGSSGGSTSSKPSSSSSSSSSDGSVNVESSPPPSSSSSSGTVSKGTGKCKKTYTPIPGDDCDIVVAKFHISLSQLYEWNPSVNHECTNLDAYVPYCVEQ